MELAPLDEVKPELILLSKYVPNCFTSGIYPYVDIYGWFPMKYCPLVTLFYFSTEGSFEDLVPFKGAARASPQSSYLSVFLGLFSLKFLRIQSMELSNLSLIDGGVYIVNFRLLKKTRDIALTVSAPHFNNGNPEPSEPAEDDTLAIPGHPIDYIAGGCSILLFLLLLLLCCRWHRGAAGSQTTRIIEQEQVQNPEDSRVASTLHLQSTHRNTSKAQEHPLTRSEPQTEYATIGFSIR
ncbi:unnamed protein product [Caretta caretta]